jgi:hypothetical protein
MVHHNSRESILVWKHVNEVVEASLCCENGGTPFIFQQFSVFGYGDDA